MRMARTRSANIASAIENLLGGMESSSRIRENLAMAYWDKIVGPQAAAATEPDSVREGVLFVRTKSSVWSHELTFLKAAIITRLNQRIGKPVIRDVIFRAQGVKKDLPAGRPPRPSEEDIAAIVLTVEDRKRLESEVRRIGRIPDQKIRESVRRRIIREARLLRWRMDHGWAACPRCDAVHPLPDSLCPLCRTHALARA